MLDDESDDFSDLDMSEYEVFKIDVEFVLEFDVEVILKVDDEEIFLKFRKRVKRKFMGLIKEVVLKFSYWKKGRVSIFEDGVFIELGLCIIIYEF